MSRGLNDFNSPKRRPTSDGDGVFVGIGCAMVTIWLLWIGVLIWAIIKIVGWVTSQ